ncbi:hypothetical protein [Shouchella shacheensis]|uniref:hypothetical protein n=1 Tax=Shouchella shacheensis TaxID=1649580 RepID=UPI0007403553|nr:hypothetical protein [Shouchella shacheensis]
MNMFLHLLRRDLRILLPLNILFAGLLIALYMVMGIAFIRVSQPLTIPQTSTFVFLLFVLLFLSFFAISVEVVWKEWRQGTAHFWYTLPHSLHLKLFSKIVSVWLWSYIQFGVAGVSFFWLLNVTAEQEFLELFLGSFNGLQEYVGEFVLFSVVTPLVSIIGVILMAFLFLGMKGWKRFASVVVLFAFGLVLYPYIQGKLQGPAAEEMVAETDSFSFTLFFDILSVTQFYGDALMTLLLYGGTWYFCRKKIEL